MPQMVPIGTDNDIALGRISEGLCTSSAILATIASVQTRSKIGLDLHLLIPMAAYVYAGEPGTE